MNCNLDKNCGCWDQLFKGYLYWTKLYSQPAVASHHSSVKLFQSQPQSRYVEEHLLGYVDEYRLTLIWYVCTGSVHNSVCPCCRPPWNFGILADDKKKTAASRALRSNYDEISTAMSHPDVILPLTTSLFTQGVITPDVKSAVLQTSGLSPGYQAEKLLSAVEKAVGVDHRKLTIFKEVLKKEGHAKLASDILQSYRKSAGCYKQALEVAIYHVLWPLDLVHAGTHLSKAGLEDSDSDWTRRCSAARY